MTKTLIYIVYLLLPLTMVSQEDPVLFTVDGDEVRLSEFEYIYSKNNGDKADYTEESLKEYLDLYINFKLKVAKARDRRIDTLPSYQEELAGYRRQLADSYIVEKELASRIAEEAFERMQKDVSFSHILVNLDRKAPEADEVKALEKIKKAQSRLENGDSFEAVAEELSEDQKSKSRGGKIGYMTAILPDGYYALENALYDTPEGKISDIVRTNLGYHIIRVDEVRPARGRISAAHILIRKKYKGVENPNAKDQIYAIYNELKNGASFETTASQKSQDNNTKNIGGKLGEFGIGQYEKNFEDVAFSLSKDGEISEPVESSIGWHIIKRLHLKKPESFEKISNELIKKTNKGERQTEAKQKLFEEIKREAGYTFNKAALDKFIARLDDSFYQFTWTVPELPNEILFTLEGESYSLKDFATFCKKRGRLRMQNSNIGTLEYAAQKLFDEYFAQKSIDYQQGRLEEKYMDFRNLMREYEEGILLFEITKEEVWDKASQDEAGIKKYYSEHREDYYWNERAKVINYSLRTTDTDLINTILQRAAKSNPEKVASAFNGSDGSNKMVMFTEETYDIEDEKSKQLNWKAGAMTAPKINNALKMTTFKKVAEIIPKSLKSLNEARGYVISDYQQYLEKKWIEELQEHYTVVINEEVMDKLIK